MPTHLRARSISRTLCVVAAATLAAACVGLQSARATPGARADGADSPARAVTAPGVVEESHASGAAVAAAPRPTSGYGIAAASARPSTCGALDQRPCLVWERIPSCDRGLVENLLAHRCVGSGPGALAANARAVARELSDLLVTLGGYITCFDAKLLAGAIRSADAAYTRQLQNSSCVQRMGAVAAARGYRTLTVGVSGGGSFVIGSFVDTGFAFDTSGKRAPTLYQTKAISIGFQAGGGVGINLGLYKGSNAVDTKGSDTQGFTFEAGAGAGAGTGIWYTYDGQLDGISVSAIAGAEGKAGAYNRINTAYYDPAGDNPMVCGGAGQRACKLWERIPSCDKGLYEDLLKGRCFAPAPRKKLSCGARGQYPCKLWERIPSCDAGLREDFFAGICKK